MQRWIGMVLATVGLAGCGPLFGQSGTGGDCDFQYWYGDAQIVSADTALMIQADRGSLTLSRVPLADPTPVPLASFDYTAFGKDEYVQVSIEAADAVTERVLASFEMGYVDGVPQPPGLYLLGASGVTPVPFASHDLADFDAAFSSSGQAYVAFREPFTDSVALYREPANPNDAWQTVAEGGLCWESRVIHLILEADDTPVLMCGWDLLEVSGGGFVSTEQVVDDGNRISPTRDANGDAVFYVMRGSGSNAPVQIQRVARDGAGGWAVTDVGAPVPTYLSRFSYGTSLDDALIWERQVPNQAAWEIRRTDAAGNHEIIATLDDLSPTSMSGTGDRVVHRDANTAYLYQRQGAAWPLVSSVVVGESSTCGSDTWGCSLRGAPTRPASRGGALLVALLGLAALGWRRRR